jgi:hypothetical protein
MREASFIPRQKGIKLSTQHDDGRGEQRKEMGRGKSFLRGPAREQVTPEAPLHWYVAKHAGKLEVLHISGPEALWLMRDGWAFGHHPLNDEQEAERYREVWRRTGSAPISYFTSSVPPGSSFSV